MSQSKRDRITLERLVKVLDHSLPPIDDLDHTTLLKLQATVKQANKLLNQLNDEPHYNYQSTSRNTQPPRNSREDLETRIEIAQKRINHARELHNARSHSSAPKDGHLDLDFLLPSLIPPPMPIPTRSTTPVPPSPPPPESKLVNSTAPIPESIPISQQQHSESTSLASSPSKPSFDLPPHPSSLSSSLGPSGLRHRPKPEAPWLKNRQLKSKSKSKETETLLPPPPSTSEDLLPASSTSPTSSDLLSHHHSLQSSLLSDLTSLSTALKVSSLTFSQNLEKDKEVLEEAEKRLEGNEGKMRVEQKRLEGVRGKSRGTTCWTIGVLAVVAAMWVGVFLLIKVT